METKRRRSVRVNRRWMDEEREKHPEIESNSTRNCKCRRWRQSVYVTGHKIIYLSISFSDSLTPFAHWHTYFEFGQSFTVRCHSGSRWCQTFLRYFNAVVAFSLTLLSHSHTIQWHIRFSVCFFSVVFRPCVCVKFHETPLSDLQEAVAAAARRNELEEKSNVRNRNGTTQYKGDHLSNS